MFVVYVYCVLRCFDFGVSVVWVCCGNSLLECLANRFVAFVGCYCLVGLVIGVLEACCYF